VIPLPRQNQRNKDTETENKTSGKWGSDRTLQGAQGNVLGQQLVLQLAHSRARCRSFCFGRHDLSLGTAGNGCLQLGTRIRQLLQCGRVRGAQLATFGSQGSFGRIGGISPRSDGSKSSGGGVQVTLQSAVGRTKRFDLNTLGQKKTMTICIQTDEDYLTAPSAFGTGVRQ
jgi:hypothetical protein